MRRFGRQCRGQGKVFVTLVRQTAKYLLEVGEQVEALARTAQQCLHGAPSLAEGVRTRLDTKLTVAMEAHQGIERQSRRLTQGKQLAHCKIVNAYDGTIAPICKGKSNCPAQFGKKPGLIAEMASGFIFALHLPPGNPGDASYVVPLLDKVQQASAQVIGQRKPVIHSLAGDLALNDASLRKTLHTRGILTVGIPRTIDPLTPSPTQEEVRQILTQAGLHRQRTPDQVHIACACGYSRPVVESFIENVLCRGAAHIRSKGHRGALVHLSMSVMSYNAATLVRIQQNRLSKRAQKLRRLLGLKCNNINKFKAEIN
jgi:hypothetical protein